MQLLIFLTKMIKTKKENKMCKYLFESLRYNRCLIRLDKVEEKYLYESLKQSIEEKNINLDLVKKTLNNLYERTDVRYFSRSHINSISKDLMKRITEYINEEVGRNYHTVSYSSEPELVKRSVSICTQTGKYIVCCQSKEIYFSDEDSAILYARNNKCY